MHYLVEVFSENFGTNFFIIALPILYLVLVSSDVSREV